MQQYKEWWENLSKHQKVAAQIFCGMLIFYFAIDIGRAMYQATH